MRTRDMFVEYSYPREEVQLMSRSIPDHGRPYVAKSFIGHNHILRPIYKGELKDSYICEVCKLSITAAASDHACKDCNFFIHNLCIETPQKIKHKAHPHPLALMLNPAGNATCKACHGNCDSFFYRCSSCNYDLHVTCAGHPISTQPQNKNYPVNLYTDPYSGRNLFTCWECKKAIDNSLWVYTHCSSGYIAHMKCTARNITLYDIQNRLQANQVK